MEDRLKDGMDMNEEQPTEELLTDQAEGEKTGNAYEPELEDKSTDDLEDWIEEQGIQLRY